MNTHNRNFFIALTFGLGLILAPSAWAVTFNFSWEGDAGYRVEGQFSFDETTAPPVITETGLGPTNHLESLTVEFFDPGGSSLQISENVVNGVSNYFFLTFSFDTATQQFQGLLDVGTDDGVDGDLYLLYDVQADACDLFQVGSPSPDASSPCTVTVEQVFSAPQAVPALSWGGLLLLVLALGAIAVTQRRLFA